MRVCLKKPISSLQYFFWRHHTYLSPLCSPCSGHFKAIGSANLKFSDSRTQVCGQLVLILWIIDSIKARNTLVHSAFAWQCLYSRLVILEGPEFNFTAVQKLFQKSKSCSRPSLFHILNSPYTKDHLLGLRCANFVHKVENGQKWPDMLCLICKFKSNCRLAFTFPYPNHANKNLDWRLRKETFCSFYWCGIEEQTMAKTSNKLELREKVRLANNLILKQNQTNVFYFDILTFHIFSF